MSVQNIPETAADVAHNFCFDLVGFHHKLGRGDDWNRIVQGHMFIDHVISKTLEDALEHPEFISLDRMTTASKADLSAALGLLPKEYVPAFKRINRLRNSISHDLEFVITADHAKEVYDLFPQLLRDLHDEKLSDNKSSIATSLKVYVVMLDMNKQMLVHRRNHEQARRVKLEAAIESARILLNQLKI